MSTARIKFTPPLILPEANIQAEIYHHLRLEGIRCCLEYRMYCNESSSYIRADLVTVIGSEIACIVECKTRTGNYAVNTEGRQYKRYKSLNAPLFYCMNFKHVGKTIELIKELHKSGQYKPADLQTFADEKKIQVTRLSRKNRNWQLLINSGMEYQYFSDYHVRVCGKIDFWPSSGKFMQFGSYKSKCGGFPKMQKELKRIHNES